MLAAASCTPALTPRWPHGTTSVHLSARRRSSGQLSATQDNEVLPQSFFQTLDYDADTVQWDLRGKPQPAVCSAAVMGAFGPAGTTILDCGCGAGDNAKWLAAGGLNVLGFDISESAVATAKGRCSDSEGIAPGTVEFVQASATDLGSAAAVQARAKVLGGFEVVLDSALLHCLDDDAQRAYVAGVHALVRPGGRFYLGCFSDANRDPWQNPRRMTEAQLRALLAPPRGWRLEELKQIWYRRPAVLASSGGAWTMAWWCRATRLPDSLVAAEAAAAAVGSEPGGSRLDAASAPVGAGPDGGAVGAEPGGGRDGLLPKWRFRTKVDDGELALLVARSDGDPRLPSPLRELSSRWRLAGAWRANEEERGACFGLGGARMWGEEFFLQDC